MDIANSDQDLNSSVPSSDSLQDSLLDAERAVEERHAQLTQVLGDVLRLYRNAQDRAQAELELLRHENEEMQRLLEQSEHNLPAAQQSASSNLTGPLQAEIAVLRRQLQEKTELLEELRADSERAEAKPLDERGIAAYESELNEFRRQLESDRQALNVEIAQLRARNAELHEAAREAELELSRERAQLGRDRAQLERMRDEIRQEWERTQRDAHTRERLASVDRLRDGSSDRPRQPESTPLPQENGATTRWLNFFARRGESSG